MATPYLIRVAFTAGAPFAPDTLRHIETLVGRTVKAFKDVTVQAVEAERACSCCDQFASICGCSWDVAGTRCHTHGCQVPA